MLKEYLFKITKEQYITVSATNKEDAYDFAEENSYLDTKDEEVVDVELIDVYEEDIDAVYDERRLRELDMDEDDDYDQREIDEYFYGC